MRKLLILNFILLSLNYAYSQDTALVAIRNYRLEEGTTFSWRTPGNNYGTFHDMTSWNSAPYTQGHLRYDPAGPTNEFVMNYRLLFPNRGGSGFNPNYQPGYPLIVMMHGGGERGNCWNNGGPTCPTSNCYEIISGSCWDPNNPPGNSDLRLLNNDHNLTHGGQPHLAAVDLAGNKLPNDPTLNTRAFPGFVLFPQNINGWTEGRFVRDAIRIIRLLVKKYNIDPNRIYIHGLSNGGYGVYSALREADWLFAAAAPMSAINGVTLLGASDGYSRVATIPMWIFQGGVDGNPTPSETETLVKNLRNAGSNVRYKKYPTLGHGVWNTAYNEPDFFTWLLSKNKANIHVDFGSPTICGTNGQGASLRLPAGFPAYQWERDGQIISGANAATYIATIPGVYRARFSRTSANPSESQWNIWSEPVTVTEKNPEKAVINQIGSVVLQDLNNNNTITLTTGDNTPDKYYWYKNDSLINITDDSQTLICGGGPCSRFKGTIVLRTSGFDNCLSPASDPKYVFFSNTFNGVPPGSPSAAPLNITAPNNLAGTITSPTSALITWRDNSNNERGFEVWRRKSTDPFVGNWVMATLTDEDIVSFHDTGLDPNTTYLYKIRAVSNNGRSSFAPANNRSSNSPADHLIITTSSSSTPPLPPQNVSAQIVNDQPPISFAGRNQTVRLGSGVSSVSVINLETRDNDLNNTNDTNPLSIDPDGFIEKYQWRQVSGPQVTIQNANTSTLLVQGANAGTYVFSLETTDDGGLTDQDLVTLNVVPFTSRVLLTGSSGFLDVRFTIQSVNYDFRATFATNLTQTATNFVSTHTAALQALGIGVSSSGPSIYFFGRSASIINPSGLNGTVTSPQAPRVNAGPDRVILDRPGTAATSRVITLSGFNDLITPVPANQSIVTRNWTQLSGPNTATIQTAASGTNPRTITYNNLIPGTYVFRLTVTDNTVPLSSYDDVTVTVLPVLNPLSAKLSWEHASTNVKEYYIHYGSDSMRTITNVNTFVVPNLPVNKLINFTVKAVDEFGNISQKSNQVTASTYYTGLQYQHTTGVWNNASNLPDINLVTWNQPEFKGTINDFNINSPDETPPGVRTQGDFFNFRFDGFIFAHLAGTNTYRFQLTANEVARLTIDGIQRSLIQVGNDASQVNEVDVSLSQGPHRITVEFVDFQGAHELQVRYRYSGQSSFINIPVNRIASYDMNNPSMPPSPTPPAPPQNLTATGAGMTQINLNWTPPATGSSYRVVVLGSSTALGTGASPASNSWVNKFSSWLQTVAPGSTVNNLAANGYTTNSVLPTSGNTNNNINAALNLNPHVILVNLPSNDVTSNIPITTTMNNFRTIKRLADISGVKMFFTTSQPRDITTGTTELTTQQRAALEIMADSIRNAFGEYVIDIYDELTDFSNDRRIKTIYRFTDGIHLNNAGHDYIFTQARDKIMPYLINYELYRSQTETGTFTLVGRTNSLSFENKNLLPGTTYYYKVRTVDFNGQSNFTPVASAVTLGDTEAPTIPTGIQITATTFTNVSLLWMASTDNVGVTGYEVFANGVLIGTTDIVGFLATNLTPNTHYNFTLKAFDASGNKSAVSMPVGITTSTPKTFYSKPTGNLNLASNWGESSDGNGPTPPGFDFNGSYYVVSNRTTSSLGGSWTVEGNISKVIVPDGVTLTADNAFNARVEIQGSGMVILDNTAVPDFISLSNNSSVQYNIPATIQQNVYGNLSLGGSGIKTFPAGTTLINGNLTVANDISLKGAPANSTTLQLAGNLIINGTPQFVADDYGIKLELIGNGVKTLSSGDDIYLNEIVTTGTSTVNMVSTSNPFTIMLGNETGGGLNLVNGSQLNVGNNSLTLKKNATINSNNQTGRIGINGGNIYLTSGSNSSSNLYFDPSNNTINRFESDLSGSGIATIRASAKITDGLKIKRGTLNSNGFVTLVSTATKTANLEQIENGGQVIGDIVVQRHIAPEGRNWKYISTPVDGVTVADWQTAFPITGNFTGASTGPGLTSSPSMYIFDEPNGGWLPYPAPGGNNLAPIQRGIGYAGFIRNTTTPTMVVVTGDAFQHNIPFTLSGGTGGDNGWNLLGNPYASTIVWGTSGWTRSGISSTVSVRDNYLNGNTVVGQFRYYDFVSGAGTLDAGKIAPGQAFWVQATNAAPSLSINEQAKINDQQTFFREGNDNEFLIVKLNQGTISDEAFLVFDNSSELYEADKDAFKRINEGMFSFATLTKDKKPVAINRMNSNFCNSEVALYFSNVKAGTYSIHAENIASISRLKSVKLKDNYLNKQVSLDAEYSFSVTSDTASFSASRFVLSFESNEISIPKVEAIYAACPGGYANVELSGTMAGVSYQLVKNGIEVLASPVVADGNNLSIKISADLLETGTNSLKLKITDTFCNSNNIVVQNTLEVIKNSSPEISVPFVASICNGLSTTIQATSLNNIANINWYDEYGKFISSGETLSTGKLTRTTTYYAKGISASGCESQPYYITVNTEDLLIPSIEVRGDSLVAIGNGGYQWYQDSLPIESGKKHFITPEQSGTYKVTSTKGGCIQTSSEFNYVITAIDTKVDSFVNLEVFPNPARNENITIRLHTNEPGNVKIKLLDTFGKALYVNEVSVEESNEGVTISNEPKLPRGLYIVVAQQGEKIESKKLIIK